MKMGLKTSMTNYTCLDPLCSKCFLSLQTNSVTPNAGSPSAFVSRGTAVATTTRTVPVIGGDLRPPAVTSDLLGFKVRTTSTFRWREWAFAIVSTVSLLSVAGLTVERVIHFMPRPNATTGIYEPNESNNNFAFAVLMLINTVFCLYYVYSGLLRERLQEVYIFIASVVIIILYCIIDYGYNNYNQPQPAQFPVKLVRLVIACCLGPVNILLAILVIRNFGWLEFRIVGASVNMQRMHRTRNLFFSFLGFDLQAVVSFLALSLSYNRMIDTWRIVGCSIGGPVALLWTIMGCVAVKHEQRWLCWCFAISSILFPAYVSYHWYKVVFIGHQSGFLIAFTNIAGLLTIIVRILLVWMLYRAVATFDRGLQDNDGACSNCVNKLHDLCCCLRGADSTSFNGDQTPIANDGFDGDSAISA